MEVVLNPRWVFFRVGGETTLALPVEDVRRVYHRGDPEYPVHAGAAQCLAACLGLQPDPNSPGVAVVLSQGDCWLAGDALLQSQAEGSLYISIAPELFAEAKVWCRGALLQPSGVAFVTDANLLHSGCG